MQLVSRKSGISLPDYTESHFKKRQLLSCHLSFSFLVSWSYKVIMDLKSISQLSVLYLSYVSALHRPYRWIQRNYKNKCQQFLSGITHSGLLSKRVPAREERAHIGMGLWLQAFLGMFAKLRKATISFLVSFRLSAPKNSSPAGRICMIFDIWVFFDNLLRKIQVSSQSDKNNGYFTWRPIYICHHISLGSS